MNIKFLLLSIALFSPSHLWAKELCDPAASKCAQIGRGAAWLLSIIETSKYNCPSSEVVNDWLEENNWLVQKVKAEEPEYAHLVEMQLNTFWKTDNPERIANCNKVTKLVLDKHPLNSSLR